MSLRTDQHSNFRFTDLAPGDYMLTDLIAGHRRSDSESRSSRGSVSVVRDDFRDVWP